jgi:hypothetical protein
MAMRASALLWRGRLRLLLTSAQVLAGALVFGYAGGSSTAW